jgi:hypothetical protein
LHGGPDRERTVAKVSLFSTGMTMALWQNGTLPQLHAALESIHSGAHAALRLAFLGVAVASTLFLLALNVRRSRRTSFAEGSFLLSSLLLFHPYLWVADGARATLAMLCGHFIQYLAIVWLLNARRYGQSTGSAAERILGRISAQPRYALTIIVFVGIAVWLISHAAAAFGVPMAFVIGLNSLSLIHFYLDGRFWAFRDPFVRRSISPYLVPESRRTIDA